MSLNTTLKSKEVVLSDEAETLACGSAFSQAVDSGLVVYLQGDLGAGKTTFVRGFLRGIGYQGKVKSPTYTLVEPYKFFNLNIYHFDLYRFSGEEEWEFSGFRDYFNSNSVCLIEWPEKAGTLLPPPDIKINIQANLKLKNEASNEGRILYFTALSLLGEQALNHYGYLT